MSKSIISERVHFKHELAKAGELRQKLADQAFYVNHALLNVIKVHDLKDLISQINSYLPVIDTCLQRSNPEEAEENIFKEFFQSFGVVSDISKQFTKSARIGPPKRPKAFKVCDFLLELSSLRTRELQAHENPISVRCMIINKRKTNLEEHFVFNHETLDANHKNASFKRMIRRYANYKIKGDRFQLNKVFINLLDRHTSLLIYAEVFRRLF